MERTLTVPLGAALPDSHALPNQMHEVDLNNGLVRVTRGKLSYWGSELNRQS